MCRGRWHLRVVVGLEGVERRMVLVRLVLSLDNVPPVGHYLLGRGAIKVVEDLRLHPTCALLALVLLARLLFKSLAGSWHLSEIN